MAGNAQDPTEAPGVFGTEVSAWRSEIIGDPGGDGAQSGAVPRRPPDLSELLPRYEDRDLIASGAMGEVRRVYDTKLRRVLAIKVMHPQHAGSPRLRKRFQGEARLTAHLQHPGIVAVHDEGELSDGRMWFTMPEVRGRILGEVIEEVHKAVRGGLFQETASGWTFRRLVDAFARVCQAVAFAHSLGYVHRDLKPENVMVGEFGQVLVMDWGLGRRVRDKVPAAEGDDPEPSLSSIDLSVDSFVDETGDLTQHGDVLGTPAYMPPEQAEGQAHRHGPGSDVYALGAILYHLLAGRPPYLGSAVAVVHQVRKGPPLPLAQVAAGGPPLPPELIAVCERAMRRDIPERYSNAEELAREVVAWLDGAKRREQALDALTRAMSSHPRVAELRALAARKRLEAQELLADVRPFDPIEMKRPAWVLEDDAAKLEVEATVCETEWLQEVHGALSIDPTLSEAHEILADHYLDRLAQAELARSEQDAARFEKLLEAHARDRHQAAVRGEGTLTLVTEPEGAMVRIARYHRQDRRLIPVDEGELGATPLIERGLPRGSYVLRISALGHADVAYPVLIERGGAWDGVRPGEREPHPILLPREGDLAPDDVYVPAGYCWIGGDHEAVDSLSRRRIWVDAFVIKRFPVTNGEYLDFLNDLVDQGREEEALAFCPRAQQGIGSNSERPVYAREGGRFALAVDALGSVMAADEPVLTIDWHSAMAYAAWLAERTGLPWRLPDELEREKAARGVDGRLFPWGDHPEPTFAHVVEGRSDPPRIARVHAHPTDESPYGARSLAGGSRDWCANLWRHDGPARNGERLVLATAAPDDQDFRSVRGGAWVAPIASGRAAARFGARPGERRMTMGIRVARSVEG